MKNKLVKPEGKTSQGGSRSEALKIILESRRKGQVLADQLREEIILEKYLNKMEAIKMGESRSPDTSGFMKVIPSAENKIQGHSNMSKWFERAPEPVRIASAENDSVKIIAGMFHKVLELEKGLAQVFAKYEWPGDPRKESLWFQKRWGGLPPTAKGQPMEDLGEDLRNKTWLQTEKVDSAESLMKNLFGRIFEKGFEKIQRLEHVLEQNDWLLDPEKGRLRFQKRCDELLSTSRVWSSKDFGEDDFRGPPWLKTLKNRYEEMTNFLRWSPSAQKAEGQPPDPEKELPWFRNNWGELSSTSKVRPKKDLGEEDSRSTPLLETVKKRFDEITKLLRWFPFAQEPEGQSPAMMSKWSNKELPLATKEEAGLEPNSARDRMGRSFVPPPEETPKAALSLFSPEAIIPKDYGALFDFGNIGSIFRQAEGELAKSLVGLGKRNNEETREMDRLKAEIENIKNNGEKIMQLIQDLREQRKGSERPPERDKLRPPAMQEYCPEDELRAVIRRGYELI